MTTVTEKQEDQQQPGQSWVVLEERSQGSIGQPLFVSLIVVIEIDYIYHHYQIHHPSCVGLPLLWTCGGLAVIGFVGFFLYKLCGTGHDQENFCI